MLVSFFILFQFFCFVFLIIDDWKFCLGGFVRQKFSITSPVVESRRCSLCHCMMMIRGRNKRNSFKVGESIIQDFVINDSMNFNQFFKAVFSILYRAFHTYPKMGVLKKCTSMVNHRKSKSGMSEREVRKSWYFTGVLRGWRITYANFTHIQCHLFLLKGTSEVHIYIYKYFHHYLGIGDTQNLFFREFLLIEKN